MKVLLVDDSRIMRNIIKNTLDIMNSVVYDVIEAGDGVAAFSILEKEDIDILLLDWNMPRLSGLDLIKKIRSMDRFAGLPIIMITSEAAKYNVIEAIKSGADDYLIKPVSEAKLLEKITRLTV